MPPPEELNFELDAYPDESLRSITNLLSNPGLSPNENRMEVNQLVMSLVTKYLAAYLGANRISSFLDIHNALEKKKSRQPSMAEAMLRLEVANLTGKGLSFLEDKEATDCLADVRATAAIVKEIIYNQRFRKTEEFIGVDLGCGTGILLVALYIAARVRGVQNISLYGIEYQQRAVEGAREVLPLCTSSGTNIEIVQGDLLEPGVIRDIASRDVSFLVAEIFGLCTRSPYSPIPLSYVDRYTDPFGEVVRKYSRANRGLKDDVQGGEVAMFPDIYNGCYVPNQADSKILLRTSPQVDPVNLWQVGEEFDRYADFGSRRWPRPSGVDRNRDAIEFRNGFLIKSYLKIAEARSKIDICFEDIGIGVSVAVEGNEPIIATRQVFLNGRHIGELDEWCGDVRDYWSGSLSSYGKEEGDSELLKEVARRMNMMM